ncbi:unnamed protein product, partial [marine sediment metagenome]
IILGQLKSEYEFIVVDAGSSFTDILIYLLDNSNLILLVGTPDVLSVYQTEWSIDAMESLHFPLNMVKLVLNRAESRGGVRWEDVRSVLRCDVIAHLPSDGRTVGLAVNQGVPFVMRSPKSKIAEAVKKLAQTLISEQGVYIEKLERPRVSEKAPRVGQFWEQYGMAAPLIAAPKEEQDEIILLKQAVHKHLLEELDLKRLDV